jgi:hypothetical protein
MKMVMEREMGKVMVRVMLMERSQLCTWQSSIIGPNIL